MNSSIVGEFLLFKLNKTNIVSREIELISYSLIATLLVLELIFQIFKKNIDLDAVLKRVFLAQFLIIFWPNFYHPIAKSGLKIADSIILKKSQSTKKGLLINWINIKRDLERKVRRNEINTKKIGFSNIFSHLFFLSETRLVEKGAIIALGVIFYLIKIIFTFIYWGTYFVTPIRCALSVLEIFSSSFQSILSGIFYIIFVPILVALVLYFSNDLFVFQASKSGFIESLEGIVLFFVLGILLFACLSIPKFILTNKGLENWGASMGRLLSAGIAYKGLSLGVNQARGVGTFARNVGMNALNPAFIPALMGAKALGNIVSGPMKTSFSAAKKGLGNHFQKNVSQIKDQELNNLVHSPSEHPLVKGRYEREFYQARGSKELSPISFANPMTHFKASVNSTKSMMGALNQNAHYKLGIPMGSKSLSLNQKLNFVGDKVFNNSSKLSKEEQIKNTVLANRISKRIDP